MIEYTLTFQISDYFGFENVTINDLFSDGQIIDSSFVPTLTFTEHNTTVSGSFAPVNYIPFINPPPIPSGTPGTINFDISGQLSLMFGQNAQLLGGWVDPNGGYLTSSSFGGTTGEVKFRTIIQEDFANNFNYPPFAPGDQSVDNGDYFENSATITGTVLKVDVANTPPAPYVSPDTETDSSSTAFVLPRGQWNDFHISVYQIKRNGVVVGTIGNYPNQALVAPGDEVTYRLEYILPFDDIEDLSFESYLPLPSLDVSTLSPVVLPPPGVPPVNQIWYNTTDTFSTVSLSPDPVITLDPVSNSIKFDYGDFDNPGTFANPKIDLLYTLQVGNQVTQDNLLLTNISYESEGSTNAGSRTFGQLAQLKLKQIPLNITKGAVIAKDTITPTTTQVFSQPVASPIIFNTPGIVGSSSSPSFSGGTINSNYLTTH